MKMSILQSSVRPPVEGREQSTTREHGFDCSSHKGTVGVESTVMKKERKYQEVTEQPAFPSYVKWAQNLHNLLEDKEGVDLYESYLKQENCETDSLNFWFICQGLKRAELDIDTHINAIYRTYIKTSKVLLEPETKKAICKKIGNRMDVDRTIFDQAQREIENNYLYPTYLNFLKSDVYLHHVQKMENDSVPVACSGDTVLSRENLLQLPTLHEELEFSVVPGRISQSFSRDRQRTRYQESLRLSTTHHNGLNRRSWRVQNPYHVRYSAFQLTSAQDSELQSLSSDAQTDDTLSVTDGSSVNCDNSYSVKHYHKRQQREMRRMAYENSDNLLQHTVIPRTQRAPTEPPLAPEQFAAILIEKLTKVQRERECRKQIDRAFNRMEQEDRMEQIDLLSMAFGGKEPTTNDSDQSILDEHVSRVWDDSAHHTPSRSPGCLSPVQLSSVSPPDKRRAPACGAYPSLHYPYGPGLQHVVPCCQQNVEGSRNASHSNTLNRPRREKEGHWNREQDSPILRSQQGEHFFSRKSKDNAFKASSKKMAADNISCVDSGVSVSESLPASVVTHDKVSAWVLQNEKYSSSVDGKNAHSSVSSSSPVSSGRHSNSKKPLSYNASRHGSLEPGGTTPWPSQVATQSVVPAQPFAQDPSMPILPPPNTTTQLMEAVRRLDLTALARGKSSSRTKSASSGKEKPNEEAAHRKSGKKTSANSELTVHYCYDGEALPYRTKLVGKTATLKQFKALLTKKGNFRYFFKTTCDDGFGEKEIVNEEITDDNYVLPLWEDKIIAMVKPV